MPTNRKLVEHQEKCETISENRHKLAEYQRDPERSRTRVSSSSTRASGGGGRSESSSSSSSSGGGNGKPRAAADTDHRSASLSATAPVIHSVPPSPTKLTTVPEEGVDELMADSDALVASSASSSSSSSSSRSSANPNGANQAKSVPFFAMPGVADQNSSSVFYNPVPQNVLHSSELMTKVLSLFKVYEQRPPYVEYANSIANSANAAADVELALLLQHHAAMTQGGLSQHQLLSVLKTQSATAQASAPTSPATISDAKHEHKKWHGIKQEPKRELNVSDEGSSKMRDDIDDVKPRRLPKRPMPTKSEEIKNVKLKREHHVKQSPETVLVDAAKAVDFNASSPGYVGAPPPNLSFVTPPSSRQSLFAMPAQPFVYPAVADHDKSEPNATTQMQIIKPTSLPVGVNELPTSAATAATSPNVEHGVILPSNSDTNLPPRKSPSTNSFLESNGHSLNGGGKLQHSVPNGNDDDADAPSSNANNAMDTEDDDVPPKPSLHLQDSLIDRFNNTSLDSIESATATAAVDQSGSPSSSAPPLPHVPDMSRIQPPPSGP